MIVGRNGANPLASVADHFVIHNNSEKGPFHMWIGMQPAILSWLITALPSSVFEIFLAGSSRTWKRMVFSRSQTNHPGSSAIGWSLMAWY